MATLLVDMYDHVRNMDASDCLKSTMDGERISIGCGDGTCIKATWGVNLFSDTGKKWELSDPELIEEGTRFSRLNVKDPLEFSIGTLGDLSLQVQTTDNAHISIDEIVDVELEEGEYPNMLPTTQQMAVELQALGLSNQQAYITVLRRTGNEINEIADFLEIAPSTVRTQIERVGRKYVQSDREIQRNKRLREELSASLDIHPLRKETTVVRTVEE